MLIDCLDSYFLYVQQQMSLLGSATNIYVNGATIPQPFGGVIFSRDWPLTEISEGSLYLLVLDIQPKGGTEGQILYEFICQWTWLLIGTNLSMGQQGSNRGDRYRTHMQIMSNLRQANFPSFCQKQSITGVDPNTQAITQVPATSSMPYASVPYNTVESIWWSKLKFPMKQDPKSGVVYGVGALSIFGFDNAQAILAA